MNVHNYISTLADQNSCHIHPSSTMSAFLTRLKSYIPQVVRNRPIACILGFEVAATLAVPYYVSVFAPFMDGRNCLCLCHIESAHEGHRAPWMGKNE